MVRILQPPFSGGKDILQIASLTPSCQRILAKFLTFAAQQSRAEIGHLVLAVLSEESLGGKCLINLGLDFERIRNGCFGEEMAVFAGTLQVQSASEAATSTEENAKDLRNSNITDIGPGFAAGQSSDQANIGNLTAIYEVDWALRVFERANWLAKDARESAATSSEHLVLAMAEVDVNDGCAVQLKQLGIDADSVRFELGVTATVGKSLSVDFDLQIDSEPTTAGVATQLNSSEQTYSAERRVLALLDANLNRAREGFRVLEDFARFVLRSADASEQLKQLRHDLVAAELHLRTAVPELLNARDTVADVGTSITTAAEMRRESLNDVVAANARRVQESLRSLEEFGKTVSGDFAAAVKQLRYRTYTIEQNLTLNSGYSSSDDAVALDSLRATRRQRLANAQLYVLLTESSCKLPWKQTAEQILAGGADIIQLREKSLSDADVIRRGRWLADACRSANALFIMNDRCDLATATGADGVHIGQDDGTVADARQQLTSAMLVGVSSHNISQFTKANDEAADYLGVGPVFVSGTKKFDNFPGLQYVSSAAKADGCPWFAIGGIDHNNLQIVIQAGASRVAVCGAILASDSPRSATEALKQQLLASEEVK